MKRTAFLIFIILLFNVTLSAQKEELITVKAGTKVLDYFPVSERYMCFLSSSAAKRTILFAVSGTTIAIELISSLSILNDLPLHDTTNSMINNNTLGRKYLIIIFLFIILSTVLALH
ncbi:MAG: hypothetical protein H6Q23_2260 [Bacteroidetes bacterium]|nr:hypothetical protein [Bacteroidota bacterium]